VGHGSCGIGEGAEALKEASVGGVVSEIRAFEAKVSGRVAMDGSGVWAGFAASNEALAKGFDVEKGFDCNPEFEKGFIGPEVEKGFAVGVVVLEPPNSCAPMLGCCCKAGSGAAAGEGLAVA
jgi:hypothetical protein